MTEDEVDAPDANDRLEGEHGMGIDPPSSVVEEEATEAVGECCWTWRTNRPPRKPFGS